MRMEKINDRQVRCMVSEQDLAAHKITLRDMKYGSRETADFFREMVTEASSLYGFNSDNLPIMIEAVPISDHELMLIISAVEDAEELDPHFAHFAETDTTQETKSEKPAFLETEHPTFAPGAAVLRFNRIDDVLTFCRKPIHCPGENALYRIGSGNGFYLVLRKAEEVDDKEFNLFINSILEFGDIVPNGQRLAAYLQEHEVAIMDDPIDSLKLH